MNYGRALQALVFALYTFQALASDDEITLRKATTWHDVATNGQTLEEGMHDPVAVFVPCDLLGIYCAYKGHERIGHVTLSNGAGTYYVDKADVLGFTDGSWLDLSIFLLPDHVGKGYFKHINDAIISLAKPFMGKTHKILDVEGHSCESAGVLQGFRGLIDLSNIPALSAALKNNKTLVELWDGQDCWITQFPAKEDATLTEREKKLKEIAQAIIAASLNSFKGQTSTDAILSTPEAREAVSQYYYKSTQS